MVPVIFEPSQPLRIISGLLHRRVGEFIESCPLFTGPNGVKDRLQPQFKCYNPTGRLAEDNKLILTIKDFV